MNLAEFLITWGPTFLFVLFVFIGIIFGIVRGFRKCLILFIHMIVVGVGCFIFYYFLVNDKNVDTNLVSFTNGILKNFNYSLNQLLGVSEDLTSITDILMQKILESLTDDDIAYWLIKDNFAYIASIVNMGYHIVLAIICWVLYFILILLLYFIYLIFYPVRRKIKRVNRKYQNGEITHPYKRRRILGGILGGVRACLTGVIMLSFLGSLIYIVSGNNTLKNRNEIEGNNEFTDSSWNDIYDYYSYVCEMSDTGIFGVLNSLKDSENTPYYFYFADLVLQGNIYDDNLGIEDKFYLRDELGEYVGFVNKMLSLMIECGGIDSINDIANASSEEQMDVLLAVFQNEKFNTGFEKLIDEFEGKAFVSNLCLSSLTSLVNHIELIDNTTEDGKQSSVVGLVNTIFKGDDAIKVTDLATEADIKGLFKGIINLVASVDLEVDDSLSEEEKDIALTKKYVLAVRDFIPVIQGLSLFSNRAEVGNKIIGNIYSYVSTEMVEDTVDIAIPSNINWVNEFNILLNSCKPLLTITGSIYSSNQETLTNNLINIFEGENASEMEKAFDELTLQLTSSQLLDVVFKTSYVGKAIDDMVVSITNDETAKIPSNIYYSGNDGECAILLKTLKITLKNGGGQVLSNMMDDPEDSASIKEMISLMTKEITVDGKKTNIIKTLIESKLLHYTISAFLSSADFGSFSLYIPDESIEVIEDCNIIKHSEIESIVDLLSNCSDLIVNMIDDSENIDYAGLLSNEYIRTTAKNSLLLKGTLANVIIGIASDGDMIVLPYGYDNPDNWLENDPGTASECEIIKLLNVVFDVADITIGEDKSLINELMNGTLDASLILDLDEAIIEKLCNSKVLQYTISDKITELGSSDFEIVVARNEIEKLNAPTTTDEKVNVVKANALYSIFVDVKRIIEISSADEVKINYNAIFENKSELSSSKTLTATIVKLLLDNATSDFIVVPQRYRDDFEKIKTDDDLTGNVWFGNTAAATDDELYLMLSAIESLITKEDGKIPADFDFNTVENSLTISKTAIDDICSSAILNASLSKQIVDIFYVEKSLFNNDTIEREELNKFFDAVFEMFGNEEINISDLESDMFDLEFNYESKDIILASKILKATISDAILKTTDISIPVAVTTPEQLEFVEKDNAKNINDDELNSLFNALFSMFGEKIKVKDISNELTNLSISKEKITSITGSHILRATMSNKLASSSDIVILKEDTLNEEMTNSTKISTIDKDEIEKLLNSMFILVGKNSINLDEISTQLSEITLKKADIDELLKSNILLATMSAKMTGMNDIIILNDDVIPFEDIIGTYQNVIKLDEIKRLLNSMFMLVGDTIGINSINDNLNNITLKKDDINKGLLNSNILVSTIATKITGMSDIKILSDDIIATNDIKGESKKLVSKDEISKLLAALFALMNTNEIGVNSINSSVSDIGISSSSIETILNSSIISTTISTKLIGNDGLIIPTTIDYVKDNNNYKLATAELRNLFNSLLTLFNVDEGNSLKINELDFNEITLNSGKVESIVNSKILLATISKRFIGIDSITIPAIVKEDVINISDETKLKQISSTEFESFLNALFATTGDVKVNEFGVDSITLPTDTTKASTMAKSLIVSATLSNNITNAKDTIICIPDELRVQYSYGEKKTDETYIKQTELANLLVALTKGIGLKTPSNLSFDNISIPKEENREALVASEIIRATISKKILEQEKTGIAVEDEIIDTEKHIDGKQVAILSEDEILKIINGITLLSNNNDNNNFDDIDLNVETILENQNKENVLKAIASSAVYRYVISNTLNEEKTYNTLNVKAYQLFRFKDSSTDIDGEIYEYNDYDELTSFLGGYTIKYPTTTTKVYTTFTVGENASTLETTDKYLFTYYDIMALKGELNPTL